MRRLEGLEIAKVKDVLIGRFDPFSIRTFTKKRLNIPYDNHVAFGAGLDDGIFFYIDYLNKNYKHYDLINGYLAEFPDDKEMLKLASEFGLLPNIDNSKNEAVVGLSALEAMVNATPFMDIDVLLFGISKVERTVCRIEVKIKNGTTEWGTGFLIGEDLLMSNYHVFKKLIEQPEEVEEVNCLFDYKVHPDGNDIHKGTIVKLNTNPVVLFSEVGQLDISGSPDLNVAWSADKLDYAIVRLERKVGAEPFGPGEISGANITPRGWISFPDPSPNIFSGSHAIIVQHPQSGPKKIVFGFEKIVGMDDNDLRVRYEINTLGGSSGSPCFNHKFELIALHNSGDPNYNPMHNQGIPIAKIKADLLKKEFDELPLV